MILFDCVNYGSSKTFWKYNRTIYRLAVKSSEILTEIYSNLDSINTELWKNYIVIKEHSFYPEKPDESPEIIFYVDINSAIRYYFCSCSTMYHNDDRDWIYLVIRKTKYILGFIPRYTYLTFVDFDLQDSYRYINKKVYNYIKTIYLKTRDYYNRNFDNKYIDKYNQKTFKLLKE